MTMYCGDLQKGKQMELIDVPLCYSGINIVQIPISTKPERL